MCTRAQIPVFHRGVHDFPGNFSAAVPRKFTLKNDVVSHFFLCSVKVGLKFPFNFDFPKIFGKILDRNQTEKKICVPIFELGIFQISPARTKTRGSFFWISFRKKKIDFKCNSMARHFALLSKWRNCSFTVLNPTFSRKPEKLKFSKKCSLRKITLKTLATTCYKHEKF